ncbi:hypothetical protein PUR61_43940 [Streptomyces sp. BE20]|nr:hypothetical protein [Streptomyces sp. BE20]MEE1829069.1 hypothetical protein [Streptomyces sp. BE20]
MSGQHGQQGHYGRIVVGRVPSDAPAERGGRRSGIGIRGTGGRA